MKGVNVASHERSSQYFERVALHAALLAAFMLATLISAVFALPAQAGVVPDLGVRL